ncbi:hypothetical protein COCOBI_16-1280 [Coccomyxa sp. Obi]|nr:hypothetical protein COCOBI_16-1280 [Coccomyxa sp. Obi]
MGAQAYILLGPWGNGLLGLVAAAQPSLAPGETSKVAGRTTEPPGRGYPRDESRRSMSVGGEATRTGWRGQCPTGKGSPQGPCSAVLSGTPDRWYRVTGAPFRAGKGGRRGGGAHE